jgi:hypothetical protein
MRAVVLLTTLTVGCSWGNLDAATSDSSRTFELLPADTIFAFNDAPPIGALGMRRLAIGSRINATWGRTISSRTNKAGETVTIIVTSDVKDDRGNVVIPSGATIELLITELAPATSRSDSVGKVALTVTSTMIRGRSYSLQGDVTSVGGAAVAARTASRDVVVNVGTAVVITLTGPLTVAMSRR